MHIHSQSPCRRGGTSYVVVFATIAVMLFSSCTLSNDDIAATVKKSMQEKFATDPNIHQLGLLVSEVYVARLQGTSYRGLATILYHGKPYTVDVDVTADGNNVLWSVQPTEFLFIAQDGLNNLYKLFEQ